MRHTLSAVKRTVPNLAACDCERVNVGNCAVAGRDVLYPAVVGTRKVNVSVVTNADAAAAGSIQGHVLDAGLFNNAAVLPPGLRRLAASPVRHVKRRGERHIMSLDGSDLDPLFLRAR